MIFLVIQTLEIFHHSYLFGSKAINTWSSLHSSGQFAINLITISFQGLFLVFHIFLEIPGYFQVLENNYHFPGYSPKLGRHGNTAYDYVLKCIDFKPYPANSQQIDKNLVNSLQSKVLRLQLHVCATLVHNSI